jgi:hypothetical protein
VGCRLAIGLTALAAMAAEMPLTDRYCITCHSAKRKAGGLSLVGFDGSKAEDAEKVIRKMRTGMMPPPGLPRPESAVSNAFVRSLETRIDAADLQKPGWRTFQRLNRAEYSRAVQDLLGFAPDVSTFIPTDLLSAGFDNIADAQTFSPTVITGYLRGASVLSRMALADGAGRRRILTCRPRNTKEEPACAARIVDGLLTQAYRGVRQIEDTRDAMTFFERGRKDGGFENGIRMALQSILASPRFLFRLESSPVDDRALASRLSFFLWARGPDAALLARPHDLEAQVHRMLADPRAEALSTRFATLWLRLGDGEANELSMSALRETQLFFDTIVREDRSVLELLTASYSMIDERLAKHYGVPGIAGEEFRRVEMPRERRGLLGHASVLASTSLPGRTSPVLRGKWVLEVLMGSVPPPPPPNVPSLDESARPVQQGRVLNTRQRIEQHRSNEACAGCHKAIDPLGLALENFGLDGAWRTSENGVPVDASAELADGTKFAGPDGLRGVLLEHQDLFLLSFTENLLTYAIGRRVEFTDMPTVRRIIAQAGANGYRFSSFVNGVVASAAFQTSEPN